MKHLTDTGSNPTSTGKAIVICSDGTWQKGGSVTPTNVWRTYQTVDPQGQPKFHDNGVGTVGLRFFRIIGGAFGYGISRNLRGLIVSLSYVYEPGDRIYLFGFSRGAFTVRVLANLICMLGIPKAAGKTPEEVERAAQWLLDTYKDANSERHIHVKQNPIADEKSSYLPSKDSGRSEHFYMPEVFGEFAVHFVGCWDSVEALGVPFEWLKTFVIRGFFSLRFKNKWPSTKIKHMYHAVCLDDERRAFHPILWELPAGRTLREGQSLEQVWFPGGHAHVGGGYAKDQLALESFEWMMEKASDAGLNLIESMRSHFHQQAYRHGMLHDSRPGFYKFYRYFPRRISDLQKTGDHVIHASAIDRIAQHTEGYAPTAIDVNFLTVENRSKIPTRTRALPASVRLTDEFNMPLKNANRYVAGRRAMYWICLIAWLILFYVAWQNMDRAAPLPLLDFVQTPFENRQGAEPTRIATAIGALTGLIYSVEHFALKVVSAVLPRFLTDTFLKGIRRLPGVLVLFAAIFSLLLQVTNWLHRAIQGSATRAWCCSGVLECEKKLAESSRAIIRLSGPSYMTRFRRAGFWLFVVLIVIAIGVVDWESYHAYELTDTSGHAEHYLDKGETIDVAEDFTTDNPLFPTTVYVEEGAVYRVMVDLQNAVPWRDLDIDGNAPSGFEPHWQHRWLSFATARFIKPRSDVLMFRLLASIGADGRVIPIGPSASTSEFTAYTSGHLFIFVNDFPGFYANNRGSAKVRIERLE